VIDAVERTLATSREEIHAAVLDAATLPEERTLLVDLVVEHMFDNILATSAGLPPAAMRAWLEQTYERHGDLACLGGVLAATWREVLRTGTAQGRISDPAAMHAIGAIVEEAVRRPHAGRKLREDALDEIDACISDLIARLFESDVLTGEHCKAVSSWCARLARKLGLSAAETTLVRRGGLLHDIGKIGTPTEVLNAPRGLTPEEWAIMQRHTVDGAEIIGDIPLLAAFLPAIRSHHERLDGRGYPDGLRGESIPLAVRVVSVADCFNAMIGRRPYRPPMAPYRALDELQRIRGSHLDPEIVEAMVGVVTGGREAL
jgi:putative nucleotidyltransferase with HDIG domain